MSREEWCTEKSHLLKTNDNRIPVLSDIKDYISTLPHNEAAETAHLLQLPLVFDCLNDSNKEQVELACEVLSLCLGSLSLGESTSRYYTDLERALKHPHGQVKIMALNEILRNTTAVNSGEFCKLLNTVVICIGNEDLGVGKLACEVMTMVGITDGGISVLLSKELRKTISETMLINEVVRLRFYDVFVNISKQSTVLQAALDSAGFLENLVQEFNTVDLLLKVNIVELLSQLVSTPHGYQYLDAKGVVEKLAASINNNEDLLYLQLCEPAILKFFGQLMHHKPELLVGKYSNVFQRLLENIDSNDFTIAGVTLDTLGYIADTDDGKIVLDHNMEFRKAITRIVERLAIFPNEIKTRALACLASLLQTHINDAKIASISMSWYNCMQGNPMDWILRYAKNPFSELRVSGLGIIYALATPLWGQEVIKKTPGLIEFLMDRSVENIKECKEIKFQIVKRLSNSPVFSHELQTRMQAFVREGPFYVQGVTEVAYEGNE